MGAGDSGEGVRKGKMGRAAFVPTDEQRARVREMVGRGVVQEDVAEALGISKPTLRKYFGAELKARAGGADLFSIAATAAPTQAAPRRKRKGGGRKEWVPTQSERTKVRHWLGLGMSPAAVALKLGKSEPTVRKVFGEEIKTAAEATEAELIDALMTSALQTKNVTAIRTALERLDRTRLADLEAQLGGPRRRGEGERDDPPGKKLQAQLAARTADQGTDWNGLLPEPTLQ